MYKRQIEDRCVSNKNIICIYKYLDFVNTILGLYLLQCNEHFTKYVIKETRLLWAKSIGIIDECVNERELVVSNLKT